MKKTIAYLLAATLLGVLVTLIPSFMITEIRSERLQISLLYLNEAVEIRNYMKMRKPVFSMVDVGVLVASFIAASVAYTLFKRKIK